MYTIKLIICLGFICLCSVSFAREKHAQKITLGIYPLLSTHYLTHRMQPLVDYIRATGVDSVTIKVDLSYENFINNARRGDYDIVQAPAHIAAYLIEKGYYEPVIMWDFTFSSVILTTTNSPLQRISDLKNKIIAIPNHYAFVTIAAISHLEDAGLIENKEYKLLRKGTHDRTFMAIMREEADAGIMSSATLSMVDTEIRKDLKILTKIENLAADLLLVRKNSIIATKGNIYFKNFVAGKYGKLFLKEWGVNHSIKAINSFDTKSLHKYKQVLVRKIEPP
jgi:ABC-type phosphate/phosphonate transport system substrate-binding protein